MSQLGNNPPRTGTDDEILAQLRGIKRSRNLFGALFPLSIVAGIILFIVFFSANLPVPAIISSIAAIITCIVALVKTNRLTGNLKEFLGQAITRPTLEEVFQVEEYLPRGGISESLLRGAGLIDQWDRYSYSDYVKGKYKGVDILYSDVHLEEEHVTTDSEGHVQRTYETVFRGQWMVCDFNRELAAVLRLREKAGLFKKLTKSSIETENVDFNKSFQILTKDGHNAFYVLTPHFMERLLEIDRLANARSYFCFQQDKVHIALHNGRNSFELKGVKLNDIENIRRKFRGELKYLTVILDELLSNDKLFKEATV